MNILFLSTENPYPPDHGHHLRTYYILRRLAETNRIFFVGFYQTEAELQHTKPLKALCAQVDMFEIPGRVARKGRYFFELGKNLLSPWPFTVQRYFRRSVVRRIAAILCDHRIDLVHFDMMHLAPYLKVIAQVPSVIVNHNIESLRVQRLAAVQRHPLAHLYLWWQSQKMRHFEKQLGRKFHQVIAVSEEDAARLQTFDAMKAVEVIPNGVDVDFFKPTGETSVSGSLIWVGGMNSPYNQDAVDYFLDDIFPKVYASRSDIKVTLVGQSPTQKLRAQQAQYPKNIEIAGYVDDVRPAMQRANIFIAPMRCGSGTKIKVLNAMAMGKAVVTTSVGAEGIKVVHGRDLMIADTAQDFAGRILFLLQNPEIVRQLGHNARAVIECYYDWRVIYHRMDKIYHELAANRSAIGSK